MPKYIRRSVVALSVDDPRINERAAASRADAIILDIVRRSDRNWQQDLMARVPAAIGQAAASGAEVFVRVGRAAAAAELDAAVHAGLAGVVITGIESAADVVDAAQALGSLESSRGIARGALEIDVEIDSAAAVWNALDIARASDRFGVFLLNEPALCRALGMQTTPQLPFDPLEYIKSQLITVATSVGAQALGMSYPLGLTQSAEGADAIAKAVRRARDTGFKGAFCPHDDWVEICNAGFRPSAEEAAYYVKVIEVFADGLKRGMASVPLDGKMVDVPVDLRAKLYLQWANRAKARDDAKARAHARASS